MKKLFLLAMVTVTVLSSCKLEKVTATDDAYATPVEEKRLAKIKQEEEYKKQLELAAQKEAQNAAEQERINKNPYYQDPSYSGDDYYDHQYASRVRRFHNNVDGAGYYDNYYTNSYYYNQNPSMWGQSIYSTYNWMPSSVFYPNYGVGLGYSNCWNCPNGGWNNNPWGYNNWNNQWGYNNYNYWNTGYGNCWNCPNYGWNNGWNNGNNNGWGYYNSFDPNSSYQYGPRGAGVGASNSPRNSFAGMQVPNEFNNVRNQFFNEIQKQQESTPRFTEISKRATSVSNAGGSNTGGSARSGNATNVSTNSTSNENPIINSSPRNGGGRSTNSSQDNSNNQSTNSGRWTNSNTSDNSNSSSGNGSVRSSNRNNSGTQSNSNSGDQNNGRSNNSIWNSGSNGGWNSGGGSENKSSSGSSGSNSGGRSSSGSSGGGGGRSGGSPR